MRYVLLGVLATLFAATLPAVESTLDDDGASFSTEGFSFNLHTSVQFRYTYHDTRAEGTSGDNGRDFSNFSLPFVRMFISGHFIRREFQYRLWIAHTPSDGLRLEDAYFNWAPVPFFNVTVGQHRVPASWDYLVDHERRNFSHVADDAFHQGWGKGVSISGSLGFYETADFNEGTLWWQAGVFNGRLASPDGSQGRGEVTADGIHVTEPGRTENFDGGFRNSDWAASDDTFSQLVDNDLMIAARLEFHPLGVVKRHAAGLGESTDFAVWKMMVSVAVNWMQSRTHGTGTFLGARYHTVQDRTGLPQPASGRPRVLVESFHGTVDGHFRWLGIAVNWALHYRRTDFEATGMLQDFDLGENPDLPTGVTDLGASVDVSYFLLEDELAVQARYSTVNFDEFRSLSPGGQTIDGDSFGADTSEYGSGLTWYFHGDNLKITGEYRYVVQQLPHGHDGVSDYRTFQEVRVQLQWIF